MRVPGIRFECLGVYKNMEMLSFKGIDYPKSSNFPIMLYYA